MNEDNRFSLARDEARDLHAIGVQRGEGDPAASGDLRLGHRAPGRGGRRASIPLHALTTLLSALGAFCLFEPRVARICEGNLRYICLDNGNASQGADNTSVRAGGVLSVGIPRFLNKSQHFTVHLFRPWRPGSVRGSDGGPRRFTAVVPTPHAYSGQWPVKTKRARARSCASVVTRKRPSLNRAQNEPKSRLQLDSLHGLASDGFVPLPGIEPNHDKWHPEKSAELVTSPIGE